MVIIAQIDRMISSILDFPLNFNKISSIVKVMSHSIQLSPESYQLLNQQAAALNASVDFLVESAIRLQYGNSAHIEQRPTPHGPQAYIRGTRIAVRHVAAMLKSGQSIDSIIEKGVVGIKPAAVYEAVAYYHDHRAEIEAEIEANSELSTRKTLETMLTPDQSAQLTGQQA